MAGRPVRTYVEGVPPLPSPVGGIPVVEGPQTQEYGDLWFYYLVGQHQVYEPPVEITPSEPAAPPPSPSATSTPAPRLEPGPPPSAFPPPPTPQEPSRPSTELEPLASPPARVEPVAALPPELLDPASTQGGAPPVDPSTALAVAREGSYRAAQEAERAARIAELEAEAELKRLMDREGLAREQAKRLLEKPTAVETPDDRAMREAFENIGKPAPASVAEAAELGRVSQVARAGARALGRVVGVFDALGPLGVMLPPIFASSSPAAEAQTNVDRELGERRARERKLERERRRSTPAGKRGREPAAPPPPPPPVPHLPGLSEDELADVLGEKRVSKRETGRVGSPRRRERPAPLPSGTPQTQEKPWWQTTAEDVAQAGWEVIWRELGPKRRRRSITSSPSPGGTARRTPAPSSEPEPQRRRSPEPSSESSPQPERRPKPAPEPEASALPRLQTALEPSSSAPRNDCPPCRTRRRPKRPSSKVPTIRAYQRRMSQNSLDNLNRGPSRKGP